MFSSFCLVLFIFSRQLQKSNNKYVATIPSPLKDVISIKNGPLFYLGHWATGTSVLSNTEGLQRFDPTTRSFGMSSMPDPRRSNVWKGTDILPIKAAFTLLCWMHLRCVEPGETGDWA